MSIRVAFFNHKGGVSKTTSVYNIGWMLAKTHKVLLPFPQGLALIERSWQSITLAH